MKMGEDTMDIKKMKVSDLRIELSKRDLMTTGLKGDLINRLQARLDEEEFGFTVAPSSGGAVGTTDDVAGVTEKENASQILNVPVIDSEVKRAQGEESVGTIAVSNQEANTVDAEKVSNKAVVAKKEVVKLQIDVKAKTAENSTVSIAKEMKNQGAKDKFMTKLDDPVESRKDSVSMKKTHVETAKVSQKSPSSLSFAEKKAARAARFGIVLKEEKKDSQVPSKKKSQGVLKNEAGGNNEEGKNKRKQIKEPKIVTLSKDEIEQRLKRLKRFGSEDMTETDQLKAQLRKMKYGKEKNTEQEENDKPVLSKEEIEKRLKRAEKFNLGPTKQTDELKAMQRQYRFAAN